MLHISEINIFSVNTEDDFWSIEGEIIFEDDIVSAFEAEYLSAEDELSELSLELELTGFDRNVLKEMLLAAIEEYEE